MIILLDRVCWCERFIQFAVYYLKADRNSNEVGGQSTTLFDAIYETNEIAATAWKVQSAASLECATKENKTQWGLSPFCFHQIIKDSLRKKSITSNGDPLDILYRVRVWNNVA